MKTRNRKKIVFLWIACLVIAFSLLFSPTLPVRAQQPQTITGTGILDAGYGATLTMTFPPAGGPVTGSTVGVRLNEEVGEGCPGTENYTFSGTFAGGDGGAASGTWVETITWDIGIKYCREGTDYYSDTWSGNYFANGTGHGTLQVGGKFAGEWHVTYPPEEFQAALGAIVTPAVIEPPTPVSAGEVVNTPNPVTAGDCLNDPLNAAGCMATPFVKQAVAALISMGATLATILAVLFGSAATTAGEAAAGAVAGTAPASAEAVEGTPIVTDVGPITFPDQRVSEGSPSESEVGVVDTEASDKIQVSTPLPPGLDDFVAAMKTINQKNIIDKKFYVVNPLQSDPILVLDGLAKAGNIISDYTVGHWTGSEGLTCEGFVDETFGPVKAAVLKQYGPGAKVEKIAFEEKSSLKQESLKDWLDSFNSDNHTLIKVTLPDKTEWSVDYHGANSPDKPPLVQEYNEVKKKWRVNLGKDEFVETHRK